MPIAGRAGGAPVEANGGKSDHAKDLSAAGPLLAMLAPHGTGQYPRDPIADGGM